MFFCSISLDEGAHVCRMTFECMSDDNNEPVENECNDNHEVDKGPVPQAVVSISNEPKMVLFIVYTNYK